MNGYNQLLQNTVFWSAFTGWFVAQGIKVVLTLVKEKRFKLERIMGSGGMPSSHSATVVAATFAVGEKLGYYSPLFALGAVFSFIVMYDAANVRMESGKQAKAINHIIEKMKEQTLHIQTDRELKELLGHTYLEVAVGAALGCFIGIVMS